MRKNNKRKGFTIVELVIVIAVIAILAAVMIPTISGVIADANEAARDTDAKTTYTNYVASLDVKEDEVVTDGYVVIDGYYYQLSNGSIDVENETNTKPTGFDTKYVPIVTGSNIYKEAPANNP